MRTEDYTAHSQRDSRGSLDTNKESRGARNCGASRLRRSSCKRAPHIEQGRVRCVEVTHPGASCGDCRWHLPPYARPDQLHTPHEGAYPECLESGQRGYVDVANVNVSAATYTRVLCTWRQSATFRTAVRGKCVRRVWLRVQRLGRTGPTRPGVRR